MQHEVNVDFIKLLGTVMTKAGFVEALQKRGGKFSLDWDAFYRAVDALLVGDAYERYKAWAEHHRATPSTSSSSKRQLTPEEGITDDWAEGMTVNRAKKQKLDDGSHSG